LNIFLILLLLTLPLNAYSQLHNVFKCQKDNVTVLSDQPCKNKLIQSNYINKNTTINSNYNNGIKTKSNSNYNLLVSVAIILILLYFFYLFFPKNKLNKTKSTVVERKYQDAKTSEYNTTIKNLSWSLELIQSLEWKRFEYLCSDYFSAKGYRSVLSGVGPDGGSI